MTNGVAQHGEKPWTAYRAAMSESAAFEGTPSDDVPAILATGRTDVTTIFLSLSARHRDGRDADYIRWHSLDHRPEQYRLRGLRGSVRHVSTPGCRAARAAAEEPYDATDHVMLYLFADPAALAPFLALGRALGGAGRMPIRLPSVEAGVYRVEGTSAAPRVVTGADVIPWRPALGGYVLLEAGTAPAGELTEVPGVAGAWWATASADAPPGTPWAVAGDIPPKQLTWCALDDDPVDVAGRLAPVLQRRWAGGATSPLLAAPFHTTDPHDYTRHLPA